MLVGHLVRVRWQASKSLQAINPSPNRSTRRSAGAQRGEDSQTMIRVMVMNDETRYETISGKMPVN
jgi:hypothetical protein